MNIQEFFSLKDLRIHGAQYFPGTLTVMNHLRYLFKGQIPTLVLFQALGTRSSNRRAREVGCFRRFLRDFYHQQSLEMTRPSPSFYKPRVSDLERPLELPRVIQQVVSRIGL